MIQIGPLLLDKSILHITGFVVAIGLVLIIIVAFIIEWWESSYASGGQPHYGNPPVRPTPNVPQPNFQYSQNSMESAILYHGTPQWGNAVDIMSSGFVIGTGNSYGTGLYLADLGTAKGYAKNNGMIIMVKLEVPSHQVVDHNSVINSASFKNWCSNRGNGNHGDNVTTYTLTVLKKRFIRVNQNFYVALAERTWSNERVVFEGVSVLGILDARGNPV